LICIYHSAVISFKSNNVVATVFCTLLTIVVTTFVFGCGASLCSYYNIPHSNHMNFEEKRKLRKAYHLAMKTSPSKKAKAFRKKLKQEILAKIMKLFEKPKKTEQVIIEPAKWW